MAVATQQRQTVSDGQGSDGGSRSEFAARFDTAWPYIRGAVLSVVLVWALVTIYMTMSPRLYASRFTLNVPGAANQTNVSLESLGQATTTPTSPFSTTALSPKVVYKEIADSEQVRSAAAAILGMTVKEFGRPRVKLVDETALMLFQISDSTPDGAKRKAEALIAAFNVQLDNLRRDELEKREAAIRRNLESYQAEARRVRDLQQKTHDASGLHSLTQYAELVSQTTALRRRIADLDGELVRAEREHGMLAARLGLSPQEADAALKIAGSPQIQKALAEFSEAQSLASSETQRFGARHPARILAESRVDAAKSELDRQLAKIGLGAGDGLANVLLAMNGAHRAELLQMLVRTEALASGKRREIETLREEAQRIDRDIERLMPAAVQLEQLKKDQIVADAVLSSAMARINASRSDIYGSYPIVQVVAAPDQTDYLVQPRLFYAVLGGVSGSLFACLAWMLAWLQFLHRARRRKSI
ncbi:MAG TPA: hypothetical protein PK970_03960 [Hyphomicrobiaceae bacterium]|nr:hypothetical protein [Hyphomicrobiaceae bacterium]